MKNFLLCLIWAALLPAAQDTERTILLKNGDKVTGIFVTENDSAVVLKTSFGQVTVLKSTIQPQSITIYLKDGNIVSGDVLSRTESQFVLQSSFGIVTINQENIERTSETGVNLPGSAKKQEFYYGQERLTDIFFDPTGFTLERGSLYLSGLSWGVALSENIDISSSYWRYLFADLNVRPKFRIYRGGTMESEHAMSIGFHLHTAGPTGKRKFAKDRFIYFDPVINKNVTYNEWQDVGTMDDYFTWMEVFAAYTYSALKDDKQGRVAYHAGTSVIKHRNLMMPRVWFAVENDITDRFKIIGQLYYDPYIPSYREKDKNIQTGNPFDVDFGFVYASSEHLRIGIHFQPYIVLFYFKF